MRLIARRAVPRPGTGRPRILPVLLALLLAVLAAAAVFSRVQVRTDLADFLPAGETSAARAMVEEVRSGMAASLILIGIEGAPPEELARISAAMTAALDRTGLFALVGNGSRGLDEADRDFLFARRYLLSPAVTEDAFATPALRRDFEGVLRGLQSSAAPLVSQYGFADPTGAALALARSWIGSSTIRMVGGAWFAGDRDRALILARTRAGGMDSAAQERVGAAIDAAFAASGPGGARLLTAGPAVFARDAARAMRADVETLSILSALLVAGLLLWRFRSPLVIAAIAVPVVLSVAAAALAVQALFGYVHGIALGFGMTMLGVTVDYPVLLIGHRKRGEAAMGTLRRIGQAFVLAVLTAAIGLAGMALSGFPGLAQLGAFSVAGLLAAAATTGLLLPRLIVAADLAPVSAGDPARLLRIEGLRRWRLLGLLPVAAAALVLVARGGLRWEDDVNNLSPVPAAARALDEEMRREIGAPDVGQLLLVTGADAETVLRREEALFPRIDALAQDGVVAGAESAARLLPSAATQEARRALLPAPDALAAGVAEAQSGLPFRAEAFRPFLDDVAASRAMPPVRPEDLASPLLAERLRPLLFRRGGGWYGVVAFQGVRDPVRLAAAFPNDAGEAAEGAAFVDVRAETNRSVAAYTAQAWRRLGWGGLAAALALLAGLRSPLRVARIAAALAAAGLVTLAGLSLAGARFSLIHIVALQFVAGVGLDYGLFFARTQLDAEERARTLRTLVTCNAMTLLTFGLLAVCRTPLLREIGETVASGAVLALVFGFLFAGPRPDPERSGQPSGERQADHARA